MVTFGCLIVMLRLVVVCGVVIDLVFDLVGLLLVFAAFGWWLLFDWFFVIWWVCCLWVGVLLLGL